MRIDRQVEIEKLQAGLDDARSNQRPPQRQNPDQIHYTMLRLRLAVNLMVGQQPRQEKQHEYRKCREQREQQVGGAVADEIDRKTGGGGAEQRSQPDPEAEETVVMGTLTPFSG